MAAKSWADALSLTLEDERSLLAASPALFAFFDVAQQTPGLQGILEELLDKPSLVWSFLLHGGKLEPFFGFEMTGVKRLDSAAWGLPGRPVYQLPFTLSLNQKPVLNCALAVTSTESPLLTSAGIVGLTAVSTRPNGPRFFIRILAAHRAPADTRRQAAEAALK